MISRLVAKNIWRQEGDPLADSAFEVLKKQPKNGWPHFSTNSELTSVSNYLPDLRPLLNTFSLPEDANSKKLHHAFRFFAKYKMQILGILGLYSLPYCYAGANGARVLVRSRKITENPEKRLLETTAFILAVCEKEAFAPEGSGLVAILNVRMMHAAARFYTRNAIPDEIPVNQEDMLGTMLAFSLVVIRGLRKSGIDVSEKEADAFMHLWEVIGELMGIRREYLPSGIREASALDKGIRERQFRMSDEGQILTKSLLDYFQSSLSKSGLRPSELMSFFLGEEISKILGIETLTSFAKQSVGVGLRFQNLLVDFGAMNAGQENRLRWNLKQSGVELRFNI